MMKEVTITIDIKRLKEIHNRLKICNRVKELWRDAKELWQEHKPPIKIEVAAKRGEASL